jgi:hypothetical protein
MHCDKFWASFKQNHLVTLIAMQKGLDATKSQTVLDHAKVATTFLFSIGQFFKLIQR